jgi:hypothetical protein
VLGGEPEQVGTAGHRAVVVDDLADHPGRRETGQPREVDRGLGVAGPLEHAALAGPQREHVPRAVEGRAVQALVGQGADGGRSVGGRDPRGGARSEVDGVREGGPLLLGVVVPHHQREAESVAALTGQRDAEDPRRVAHHEGDVGHRGVLGRHHEVTLILAVLVVDDDDHPAVGDLLQRQFDAVEAGRRAGLLGAGHSAPALGEGVAADCRPQ